MYNNKDLQMQNKLNNEIKQRDSILVDITVLEKSIMSAKEKLKILNNKPYREVKERIAQIENDFQKKIAQIEFLKIELTKSSKLSELYSTLSKKPQIVNCIVRKSAGIRYGAAISIDVRYDITNDIGYNGCQTAKEAIEEKSYLDHEDASDNFEMIGVKFGDKYFFESSSL